jgi:methylenetetrahydrofolate reductase (NADPH)
LGLWVRYVARTAQWDDFPNGRWGDARSPAFGEAAGGHSTSQPAASLQELRLAQRHVHTPQQLWDIFADFLEVTKTPHHTRSLFCFVMFDEQGRVGSLPWIEGPLQAESGPITDALKRLNRHGFLTINSQPRVNGLPR